MKAEFYNHAEGGIPPAPHPFPDGMPITADYRDLGPTAECPCGGVMFYALLSFDMDGEIGAYVTDGLCAECHALVRVTTPIDVAQYNKQFGDSFEPEDFYEDVHLGRDLNDILYEQNGDDDDDQ